MVASVLQENKLKQMARSLPLYDLKAMANELIEFKQTTILPTGKIHAFIKNVHNELRPVDYGLASSVTLQLITDEIIERFAK